MNVCKRKQDKIILEKMFLEKAVPLFLKILYWSLIYRQKSEHAVVHSLMNSHTKHTYGTSFQVKKWHTSCNK